MKKTFKKLAALSLAGLMCLSMLAGCGKTSTDTTPTPGVTQAEQQTPATDAPKVTEAPADPTPTPTPVPVEGMQFTGAPGLPGEAKDRLPVQSDVFIEQVNSKGEPLEIGTYGGTLNLVGSSSSWNASRPILESIIHYNSDGSYYPNVIKEITHNADSTVWTFKLREGMKWSDGVDFTADDIVFWYEQCHLTNYDSKKSWKALFTTDADGNQTYAVLTKVNDYEVTWTFAAPKYEADFVRDGDFKWCWAPKHYLEDLIPQSFYAGSSLSDEQVLANAQAKGIQKSSVKDLGKAVAYYWWNVSGIPTLNSYVLSTKAGVNDINGELCVFERNAYFWKVDAEGQQLPYCDAIDFITYSEEGQDQLAFRSGEIDMIEVAMQDIASILADVGGTSTLYTMTSGNWGGGQVTFNQTCTDANYQKLFANADFRQAISISVDRNEYSELISNGFSEPGQCAPAQGTFGYDAEWEKKWTEYDVAKAKSLLEGCGLVMGDDGFYNFADGSDVEIVFLSYTDSGAATSFPILEQYYRAVGLKTALKELEVGAYDQEIDNNTWYASLNPHTAVGALSLASRTAPFVPNAQAAEWYGEYGTYYQTKGERGVKPEGDMAELVALYEKWASTEDQAERDKYAQGIYDLHEKNLWSISYLKADSTYRIVTNKLHNIPDYVVSDDLYQYANILHFWTMFKEN